MLEKVTLWLKEKPVRDLPIYVYNVMFYVSRCEVDGEVLVSFSTDEQEKQIQSEEELVQFIRDNVPQSPRFDDVVLFNVENAIWKALRIVYG